MGQKIHPLGFRLGATQSHDSIWFAQPIIYSKNIKEDKMIRYCIVHYILNTINGSIGIRCRYLWLWNWTNKDSKKNRSD
ncbi:unnamed protein product [Lathyrus oleraceus]